MKSRILKIMIVLSLIFTMTMTNFIVVGNSFISYALDQFDTNNRKVEFNAYFKNIEGEKVSNLDITTDNLETTLYLYVNIKQEGYMNSKIKIENSNFRIKTSDSQYVNKIEGNSIILNQINAGSEVEIPVKVEFLREEQFDISLLNKETTISIEGIYKDQQEKDHEIEASKNVVLKLIKQNVEIEDKLEVVTNKILKVSGEEKRVLQLSFSTELKDTRYPIKQIDIEIDKPKIDEKLPEVSMVGNLNTMTKLEYNNEDEKVKINLKNEVQENNSIQWKQQGKENVILTYIYDADVNVEEIELIAKTKTTFYDDTNIEGKEIKVILTAQSDGDSIITANIYNTESEIHKGALYEGFNREIVTKTELNVNMVNVVEYLEMTEKNALVAETGNEQQPLQIRNIDVAYKKTVLNKEDVFNILGNEGTLTLIDQDGNELAIINSSKNSDENGNIVIEYGEKQPTEITVKTTKPVKTGKIEITNYKLIKSESNKLLKTDRKILTELYLNNNLIEQKSGAMGIATAETLLKESVTEAKLEINKTELSTMINNSLEIRAILKSNSEVNDLYENPTIKIVFPQQVKNISIEDVKMVYEDELKIKDYSLNGNILTINVEGKQTHYAESTVEGPHIIINAMLEFDRRTVSVDSKIEMIYTNQNVNIYANQLSEGSVSSDIKIVAPTDVTMINSIKELSVEEIGQDTTTEKIIPVNKEQQIINPIIEIINNKENAIKDVKILGTFPTRNENKNNIDIKITEGISIEGAKVYYTKNENATDELQNSQNAWEETLSDGLNVRKYLIVIDSIESKEMVYASYKVEIPENLQYNKNAEEGYQVTYTDSKTNTINTIKSVNIKLTTGVGPILDTNIQTLLGDSQLQENSKIHTGEVITYSVKVKNSGQEDAKNTKLSVNIPEELVYVEENMNNSTNVYEEKQDIKTIEENIESIVIGKELTFNYHFKVKQTDSDNVKLEFVTKYKEIEDKKIIENSIEKVDIGTRVYYFADKEVFENTSVDYNVVIENFTNSKVQNVEVDLKNIEGTELVSAELYKVLKDVNSDEYEKTLEIKDGKVNIGDIEAGETKQILITRNIKEISEDNKKIALGASVIINGKQISTNTVNLTGRRYNVIAEISEEKAGGYITPQDTLKYSILLKNLGNVEAKVRFVDIVPSELNIKDIFIDGVNIKDIQQSIGETEDIGGENATDDINNMVYVVPLSEEDALEEDVLVDTNNEGNILEVDEELSNEITREVEIKPNGDITIEIVATVDGQEGDFDKEVKVNNKAQVLSAGEQVISETREVFHIIRNSVVDENQDNDVDDESDENTDTDNDNTDNKDNTDKEDNPNGGNDDSNVDDGNNKQDEDNKDDNKDNSQEQKAEKYIISGIVWVDLDRDGQLTKQDELLNNKTVKLIDMKENKVVKEITTNENGEYLFTETEVGEYMVVCEYDSSLYSLVTYKQEGVEPSRGSSVISKKLTLENEEKMYAATDIIKVEDKSIPYKNIGFVKAEKFDLKLEKFVSKMSIQNSSGITVKEYDNATLAKIELDSKVVNGTMVIVEYKIRVSNVGEIEGYVKNVVDYIPSDLKFNSELNKDWYQSGSNLYNTSLANDKLKVGESKELTLILIKEMTENNLGRVNNTAEIAEAYNEFGIVDNNSTPANRAQNENDMGAADIIISLRTGATTIYVTIVTIIVLLALSAVIVPIIKKNKKTGNSKLDRI